MMDRLPGRLRSLLGRMSMRSQIVVLLLGSQLLAHSITIFFIMGVVVGDERRDEIRTQLSQVFVGVVSALDTPEADEAYRAIETLVRYDNRAKLLPTAPENLTKYEYMDSFIRAEVPEQWSEKVNAYYQMGLPAWSGRLVVPFVLVAELGNGEYFVFTPAPSALLRTAQFSFLTLILLLLSLPLALLTIWASAFLIAPVRRLADGVAQFAENAETQELKVSGAREVQSAIRAFNTMQRKLKLLIDNRAQTLAAIGHDMRTPITRLRLRLETVDLGNAAEGTNRDLTVLETMIDDALEFLRSESRSVDLGPVDITSLCESAVNDMTDRGCDVEFVNPGKIEVVCDITLTLRTLNNVLENASKYAGKSQVRIRDNADEDTIDIIVKDEGPGIPEELLDTVQLPFNRLPIVAAGFSDAADIAETKQGFGLGLAIAVECMERQGGRLSLAANDPSGLIATLHLPKTRHATT